MHTFDAIQRINGKKKSMWVRSPEYMAQIEFELAQHPDTRILETCFGSPDISPDTTDAKTLVNTVGWLPHKPELIVVGIYPKTARKLLEMHGKTLVNALDQSCLLLEFQNRQVCVAVFDLRVAAAKEICARLPTIVQRKQGLWIRQVVVQDPHGNMPWEWEYDAQVMCGQTLLFH